MTDLKILFDNQIFASQKYGGVSRIFYELISGLCEKEMAKVFLFHGLYINDFPLSRLKNKMAFYFGKKIYRFPHTAQWITKLNTSVFECFMPDKHMHIFHPTDYSRVVYSWKKTPLVLTVFDMIPELFPHLFENVAPRLEEKRKCVERADRIITISHNTKKDLLNRYDLDEKKVKVVYLGSTLNPLNKKRVRDHTPDKPFILYVGRRRLYKNFNRLLTAFAANKRINNEFILVCFGGGKFSKDEINTISQKGCKDKVFYLSGDDRLLERLYLDAEAFVYPSLYEGFGLPPLEAMSYGCPVAAANISSLPEVLGDAPLYFNPYDPDSIAEAIEKILFDSTLIDELVRKGSEQFKKYSWAKMTEEHCKVYKEIHE